MAPPSRFRPWEHADLEDAPHDAPNNQNAKSDQIQSLVRPQYQTRSVCSSSYHHSPTFRNDVRPDPNIASNQEVASSLPTGALSVNKRSFAAPNLPEDEDQRPRKRSLKTLQAKPTLLHSNTTESNLSLSSGEALARYGGPRVRNASVACLQCRAKRRKCVNNGQSPCEACIANDMPCVIDRSLDQRRKAAHQRRGQQSEQEKHILADLLEVLRQPDMMQVHAAIDFVRSGASHEQLDGYLRSCLGSGQRDDPATSPEHIDGTAAPADDASIPDTTPELLSDMSNPKEAPLASDRKMPISDNHLLISTSLL